MDASLIERYRTELAASYPGSLIKVAPDHREMVAELSDERAIAIIERSQPHFHAEITEIYRVLRGTLLVARAGMGIVLQVGDSITITPGQIHHALRQARPRLDAVPAARARRRAPRRRGAAQRPRGAREGGQAGARAR